MEQYDMHVHSRFSFDGKDELPKECAAARERVNVNEKVSQSLTKF